MPPHRPLERPLPMGLQDLPIRSILLLSSIVAAVVVIMVMAAMAYEPSRLKAKANSESVFLNAAAGQIRGVFPDGNFRGAGTVWAAAQARQEPWSQSPNQREWKVTPVALQGTFPRACKEGQRCTALLFQYDYFSTLAMDPKECQQLLLTLSSDFEVQSMQRGGMTPEIAQGLCDRTSPSAPPLLYVVAR